MSCFNLIHFTWSFFVIGGEPTVGTDEPGTPFTPETVNTTLDNGTLDPPTTMTDEGSTTIIDSVDTLMTVTSRLINIRNNSLKIWHVSAILGHSGGISGSCCCNVDRGNSSHQLEIKVHDLKYNYQHTLTSQQSFRCCRSKCGKYAPRKVDVEEQRESEADRQEQPESEAGREEQPKEPDQAVSTLVITISGLPMYISQACHSCSTSE